MKCFYHRPYLCLFSNTYIITFKCIYVIIWGNNKWNSVWCHLEIIMHVFFVDMCFVSGHQRRGSCCSCCWRRWHPSRGLYFLNSLESIKCWLTCHTILLIKGNMVIWWFLMVFNFPSTGNNVLENGGQSNIFFTNNLLYVYLARKRIYIHIGCKTC